MDSLTILGIAASLAMDAFSVCIAAGVNIKEITGRHYFRLSFHFGLFQFLMPIIGYYCGASVEKTVGRYDHWIVLIILSVIGMKMIYESFSKKTGHANDNDKDPSRGTTLVLLSIATSIDAAAVGFSLATLKTPIFMPALIIGLTCMAFSLIGIGIGKRIGSMIGKWAERIGGLILIIIGIKVVLEHLLR
jgi:putative Mn2+ efflux pump MntP